MKKLKKVIPIIIAFIIGISTTVTAATIFRSEDVTYSSDKTDKTNVKDSLDELYTKAAKIGVCPEGSTCLRPISTVDVGDYIFYRLSDDSNLVSKSLTGYTIDQTVDLSSFFLWLVIQKNEDGTVKVASVMADDYQVAPILTFKGVTGYKNFAYALKRAIGLGGFSLEPLVEYHPFGYKDQMLQCSATNTSSSCPTDYGYDSEYELFDFIAGPLNNPGDFDSYWLSSREWVDAKNLNLISTDGRGFKSKQGVLVNNVAKEVSASLRIVMTFKSSVLVENGDGTKSSPLHITYFEN